MLERDIENLIAAFPEDFFPSHKFVLKGRQRSFAGVGRFDLLFRDRQNSNVLMELKAVTANYENATQLAKYKEALEIAGERNIVMWLIAPAIPTCIREFLDRIGIQYSEIHEAEFLRVAERHGVKSHAAPSPPVPKDRVDEQVSELQTSPGRKAAATKGKIELTRAAKKAAWTKANGKNDAMNPFSKQNYTSISNEP